ncbi:hypothetical protein PQ455_14635 [Sphingomonas naphthae]|uniref:XRE family transcriptional regulator n=1 Tax=Sphingomonas naphthae TaxID=1813468 RepID=A0ABY7TI31_9SPHN|nr:hypothetical protein [Sphingomonas naphthae]WCT72862.1 hypothetical protein PQ455_14635 [Sphingomonas naphthae]
MRPLDPAVFAHLRRSVTTRTDEALMAQFGISYNTWRKLEAGLPIRPSLASRIEARFGGAQADA